MKNLWNREPALFLGLSSAVLALGVAFGLDLSDAQTAAITGVEIAGLAFITRSKVSPS